MEQLAISDAGADISRATYDATFTSLHHALAKGHMEVARLLVEKGADVNVLNEGGCYGSSLHYRVYKDDVEFTKYKEKKSFNQYQAFDSKVFDQQRG